jgi:hypothetical protein
VQDLLQLLRSEDHGLARLERLVTSGELRAYLETRRDLDAPLRRQVSDLLGRLGQNPPLALFALRYALAPGDPLRLTHDMVIRSPGDIAALVAAGASSRDAVIAGLRELIGDGRLREWLRLVETPGPARAVAAMDEALRRYPREGDLPVYAFLWRRVPDLGLPVGDTWVKTPRELAGWIDGAERHRDQASRLLDSGWIPIWLNAIGRLDHADRLSELASLGMSTASRVETLLWLLDPSLPGPAVVADPPVPTGTLSRGKSETTLSVTLRNTGRAYAWGGVDLEGAVPGIRLLTPSFDGTPAELSLRVTRAELRSTHLDGLVLVVRVRGPREDQLLRVPIELRIRGPVGVGAAVAPPTPVSNPPPAPEPRPAPPLRAPRPAVARRNQARESPISFAWLGGVVGAASGAVIGAPVGALLGFVLFLVVFLVIVVVTIAFPLLWVVPIAFPDSPDVIFDFLSKLLISVGGVLGAIAGTVLGASSAARNAVALALMVLSAVGVLVFGLMNFAFVESLITEGTFFG